jgi:Fe-coproporphyrin III synthase
MSTHLLGPTALPILHLHVLRRCNLRCLHCYSSSGPGETDELSLPGALAAIDLAAAWGYTHVAVSGGEPLLYCHLDDVLEHALRRGLSSSVVTNGLRATRPEILETLRKSGNVTVSFDGAAPRHDAMRLREGAFDAALRALEALSRSGIDCGAAYGATRANVDDLEATLHQAQAMCEAVDRAIRLAMPARQVATD